jgi:uncharacterized protein (DUF4415 family)
MSRKKDDAASRPDEDNPEWTREEIRTARPALDAIAEFFGTQAAETIRRRGGRPPRLTARSTRRYAWTRTCWMPTSGKAPAGKRS